jgi:hypothetical protein
MANEQPGAGPYPKLTKEGIRRLIGQLDNDLKTVLALGAPAALKQDIQGRISQLKINLMVALSSGDDPTVWVLAIAPQFKMLTAKLVEALGASVGQTGACYYEDGCIECTSAQCDQLGGAFISGGTCP